MPLVIFDIDGTLFQTELVTVPAVQRTFVAFGLPEPDAATICSFFGRPNEEYEAWLGELAGPEQAAAIVEATNELELELIGSEGKLYSGVREMLDTLRTQGYALAICSNGPDSYVERFIDAHMARAHFDLIRTRGTTYSGKHDMLADILRVHSARPAIMVGDRGDDVSAAHACGIPAIVTEYGFGQDEELRRADARVSSASEIPALVARMLARSV